MILDLSGEKFYRYSNESKYMKIETEIKLILESINIEDLTNKIEKTFNLKRTPSFHQTTHQFFYEDYTKQTAFPRVRNEEDGRYTLTVKAKVKDESGKDSDYFKRIELAPIFQMLRRWFA